MAKSENFLLTFFSLTLPLSPAFVPQGGASRRRAAGEGRGKVKFRIFSQLSVLK